MKRYACPALYIAPCRRLPRSAQQMKQPVVSVSLGVLAAAVLWLVTSLVWCHPDLQKPCLDIFFIHFLRVADNQQQGPNTCQLEVSSMACQQVIL